MQVPKALSLALALVDHPAKEKLSLSSTKVIYPTYTGFPGLWKMSSFSSFISKEHFEVPVQAEIIKLLNPSDSFFEASFKLEDIWKLVSSSYLNL